MKECTKPNCDCIEIAEAKSGGLVRDYPCLSGKVICNECKGTGYNSYPNHDTAYPICHCCNGEGMLNSDKNAQESDTTEAPSGQKPL